MYGQIPLLRKYLSVMDILLPFMKILVSPKVFLTPRSVKFLYLKITIFCLTDYVTFHKRLWRKCLKAALRSVKRIFKKCVG